jgi:hypothetical protein
LLAEGLERHDWVVDEEALLLSDIRLSLRRRAIDHLVYICVGQSSRFSR